jgi:hypothetical protein
MENLEIKGSTGTYLTPTVNFSAESGVCELKGESYHEDTFEFYNQLGSWVEKFIAEVKKPLTLNINLTYFNTASSRGILDLLNIVKGYEDQGGKVVVNWYYNNWDEDMLEEIEDMAEDSGLNINKVSYEA